MPSAAEQQLFLHYLPRLQNAAFNHWQPLHFSIDVNITFHYVTSQFSAFGRLGVARHSLALLAGLGVSRRYRCLQISTFTDLSVARRHCSQVSQRWQPHAAIHGVQQAQVAKPWGGRFHPITIVSKSVAIALLRLSFVLSFNDTLLPLYSWLQTVHRCPLGIVGLLY